MRIGAILLMGGKGARLHSEIPKQFQMLGGKRVYEYALGALKEAALFDEIVVVVPKVAEEFFDKQKLLLQGASLVVVGGETRQESSYRGLLALDSKTNYVLIHDAARPFVDKGILDRNLKAMQAHVAVNTCIPTADSINFVSEGESKVIFARGLCMRGQTPQTFSYPVLLDAHEKTIQKDASCDCTLLLEQGHPVHIVEGALKNFKITTMEDLRYAEFLLAEEAHRVL